MDSDGILRVGGRLELSSLPYDAKHPVILPKKHHISKLVVAHVHNQGHHNLGVNFTVAELRQKFWIVNGREEIKRWERECNFCKLQGKRRGETKVTDEELLTAVVEVEGILNSRPLTYCSSDPNDEHVLTPNHFLYGQAGGQLAPRVVDEIAFNPRNRWRFVHDLINKCWRRWMKEYLSTLNTRSKWVDQKRNVAPGDVVLLVDTSNPKGQWPLGRIQEVFPGPDGQVRVVRVRTAGKDYVRPITKLCPLEL
ncbi:hypothetical protein ACROYT_G028901 [Oculina patagonica]